MKSFPRKVLLVCLFLAFTCISTVRAGSTTDVTPTGGLVVVPTVDPNTGKVTYSLAQRPASSSSGASFVDPYATSTPVAVSATATPQANIVSSPETAAASVSIWDRIWTFLNSPVGAIAISSLVLWGLSLLPAKYKEQEQKWWGVVHGVYSEADNLGLLNRWGHREDMNKIVDIFNQAHIKAYGTAAKPADVQALTEDLATVYHQDNAPVIVTPATTKVG